MYILYIYILYTKNIIISIYFSLSLSKIKFHGQKNEIIIIFFFYVIFHEDAKQRKTISEHKKIYIFNIYSVLYKFIFIYTVYSIQYIFYTVYNHEKNKKENFYNYQKVVFVYFVNKKGNFRGKFYFFSF